MIAADIAQSGLLHKRLVDAVGLAADQQLLAIAESLRQQYFPGAILPAGKEAESLWVFAPSRSEWHRLAPLLEARIGHTLSDFGGVLASAIPDSHITAALDGRTPEIVGRVRLHPTLKFRKGALVAVRRLVENVSEHSRIFLGPKPQRSVSALLRTAERAFERSDFDTVRVVIGELEGRQCLDALNLRYLRVRALAAAGKWKELKKSGLLQELTGVAVPHLVAVAIEKAERTVS